jgi:hypothetical protein
MKFTWIVLRLLVTTIKAFYFSSLITILLYLSSLIPIIVDFLVLIIISFCYLKLTIMFFYRSII